MNIPGLDHYLTTQSEDDQNALSPRYCDCGATLTDDDFERCLLCDERIDLGRLDGPEYDESEGR